MVEPWLRREDERLLGGTGRYVADLRVPGCLEAAFVRSPVAHGILREVDCTAAREVPGVAGAWSAADLPDLPPLPHAASMGADGWEWPALVKREVRYPGEALAVVLGEDRYRAEDGVAQVVFWVDELPAVVSVASNDVAFHGEAGEPIDDTVWERAAVVVEGHYRQQLLMPSPMECRTFLCVPKGDGLIIWSGHQAPHRLRRELAALLGWELDRIRVVVPDTGGAFGSKSALFPEYIAVAALALELGRPVRWVEDRRESMLVATRGRGQDQKVRLAADSEGRLLAYELEIDADVGAYPHLGAALPMQTAWMATGPYLTPHVHATVRSVLTNTMVTYPYRGAGRPEAASALERTMDTLARRLHLDPAELRRRNFIPPERFPYLTPTGRDYDSADYAAALDLALRTLGYDAWRAEQARRRSDPAALPLGIGLSCYVERSGGEAGGLYEYVGVEAGDDGTFTARCGAAASGQSHETVFPALVAATLGVDAVRVHLIEGDTTATPDGVGSFASRSAQVDGAGLQHAAGLLIDRARERAATLWEVPVDTTEWSEGVIHGPSTIDLAELVKLTGPLRVDERYEAGMAFPYGAHAAVVEVDPDLGTVHVLRLVAVDDCGHAIDPDVVRGQAFGSAVQGLGQALYEGIPFGADGVPELAGGLLDYLLPTYTEIPPITLRETSTPSPRTPLGAKGAGESGCIGTPPAIVNAVADALRLTDADVLQMPLTPDVVWRAAS
ncbi:xanthine dehydrogenase family protein molybdopterin-binding subunit [Herbidospora sp. RD11066]